MKSLRLSQMLTFITLCLTRTTDVHREVRTRKGRTIWDGPAVSACVCQSVYKRSMQWHLLKPTTKLCFTGRGSDRLEGGVCNLAHLTESGIHLYKTQDKHPGLLLCVHTEWNLPSWSIHYCTGALQDSKMTHSWATLQNVFKKKKFS